MRKSSDSRLFARVFAVAALALAGSLATLHPASARDLDPPGSEQPREGDDQARGRGRVRESAPPRQDARREAPPPPQAARPDVPAREQRPPMFGAVPPRDRAEGRERAEPRDRAEFRQRPGVTFGAPLRPELRVPSPRSGGYRVPPPDRIVPRLPPGYRQYYWSGSPYYHFGGRWYRPYGSSFLIVGAPFGLFVPYLPSYYSTLWVGDTRYYLADDTYYVYDPMRRGYVVTRSPYGGDLRDDDEYEAAPAAAPEMFVYPMRGQSEQQQADDRYQCHRWAVEQAHYDPTEAEYRAADRAEYDRATTACLAGRGYSVK